jgi:hypothetical protein
MRSCDAMRAVKLHHQQQKSTADVSFWLYLSKIVVFEFQEPVGQ